MSAGLLTKYFEKIAHKATWEIGDRVSGVWNSVPFIGTVGCENIVDPDFGPRVTVQTDLPIMHEGKARTIIIMKPNELKRLKNYE